MNKRDYDEHVSYSSVSVSNFEVFCFNVSKINQLFFCYCKLNVSQRYSSPELLTFVQLQFYINLRVLLYEIYI